MSLVLLPWLGLGALRLQLVGLAEHQRPHDRQETDGPVGVMDSQAGHVAVDSEDLVDGRGVRDSKACTRPQGLALPCTHYSF